MERVSIQVLHRCSLLILFFHATLSKKVTVNRFPRFSQWAIACFLFPLIFQCRGIKCVTHHPVQSNACLLHGLLTWRGKSHDASTRKKKKAAQKPKQWTLPGLEFAANRGGHVRGCSGPGGAGLGATRGRDDGLVCWWYDGMMGRWVVRVYVRVWKRLRRDHDSRGGRGSCPWRDLVWLQTTWLLRVTLPRGCPSTHPQPTSSANGPLKALSSQSPPTPTRNSREDELCSERALPVTHWRYRQ